MKRMRYTVDDVKKNRFYQMPKFLFEGEFKKGLSNDAKVLYSLLRDRHEMSVRNGWVNQNNEVFLKYTREDMADMLGVSQPTVRKTVGQLKKHGLIDEERMGLNKANRIYLIDVTLENTGVKESFGQSEKISQFGVKESFGSECKELSCNDTDFKDTDLRDTKSINQSKEDGTDRTDGTYIPKNKKSPSTSDQAKATNDVNKKTHSLYKEIIAQNIEYANLKEAHPHDNMLEDLFELIVEVVTSSKETIRVNKENRPTDIVKATYLKLNASDIEYVMKRMKENTTKASNIRAYMLTTLYNAPKTRGLFYSNLVQHDLAQINEM